MSDLSFSIPRTGLAVSEAVSSSTKVDISNTAKAELSAELKAEKAEKAKKEEQALPAEDVEVAVGEINAFVQSLQRNLSFTVDDQLGQEIISVTDVETDEVIRQIPSLELVVLRKKMDDVVGILFDTKV